MTLTEQVAKNIIRKLLAGDDYRIEVVTMINAEFLQFVLDFFKQIINTKIQNQDINLDWYKAAFLNSELTKEEIAINSGLNMKTISNMYNSATKAIVIDASNEHYDTLYGVIKNLIQVEKEIDLTLTLKFNGVSVDLNVNETLIVINTLAVKRAALRGGLWSTAGKRVEKPLMITLCKLYEVPESHYAISVPSNQESTFEREIDFYLVSNDKYYKCEVKLMGKGNPESADAVIARDSSVFIADKLSDTNKSQLDSLGINWVELRDTNGFRRFEETLTKLNIPHSSVSDVDPNHLENIFAQIF
jgi:hypothetical protein